MPFQEALTAVYEHGIKPQVELMGYECKRADEVYSTQGILADIWDSIQKAELIIADLTGRNPNVMYELGLCHTLWKHVILISQNKDDVPFDLRQWRVIWYDFTFAGAARLKEELGRAMEALKQEKQEESRIVPLAIEIAEQDRGQPAVKWHFGTIDSWKADRHFGFIKSEGEDFWYNNECLFAASMLPIEGKRVIFEVLPALPNAKNRRATRVFIKETALRGKVSHVAKDKGYAFARVEGQHGDSHSMFLETGGDFAIAVDSEVEFVVGENRIGPTGCQVRPISPETGA